MVPLRALLKGYSKGSLQGSFKGSPSAPELLTYLCNITLIIVWTADGVLGMLKTCMQMHSSQRLQNILNKEYALNQNKDPSIN